MDRNEQNVSVLKLARSSPPARVAWIETSGKGRQSGSSEVATREGGVDRNKHRMIELLADLTSPPARVAWIETLLGAAITAVPVSPPARVAWIET